MPYCGCLPDLRFRFQLSTRREQKETLPKHTWSAEAFLEEGPISGSLSGSTGAIARLKDDHKQRLGPQIINSPMLPESIKSKDLNKRAMLLAICLQLRAHRFCRSRKRSLGSEPHYLDCFQVFSKSEKIGVAAPFNLPLNRGDKLTNWGLKGIPTLQMNRCGADPSGLSQPGGGLLGG